MEKAFLNRWVSERRQCQCDRVGRIPDSQGLELKGTLVKRFGLCFGNRKGPFLTVSERAERFKEAQTGKEKSGKWQSYTPLYFTDEHSVSR